MTEYGVQFTLINPNFRVHFMNNPASARNYKRKKSGLADFNLLNFFNIEKKKTFRERLVLLYSIAV